MNEKVKFWCLLVLLLASIALVWYVSQRATTALLP